MSDAYSCPDAEAGQPDWHAPRQCGVARQTVSTSNTELSRLSHYFIVHYYL